MDAVLRLLRGGELDALSSFGFTPLDLIQQGVAPRDRSAIPELVEFLESIGCGYYFYGGAQGAEWRIPKPQANGPS